MPQTLDLQWDSFEQKLSEFAFKKSRNRDRPLFVGIDGPDCSGKSTLSKQMVRSLKSRCQVLPLHFDDYFNGQAQIANSEKPPAQTFREDYFDWEALQQVLRYLSCSDFDHGNATIIIVEGLFLFEKDRRNIFDMLVRLEMYSDLMMSRALARDVGVLGSSDWVKRHYSEECIPAQTAYIKDTQPGACAHFHFRVLGESGNVRAIKELSPCRAD